MAILMVFPLTRQPLRSVFANFEFGLLSVFLVLFCL